MALDSYGGRQPRSRRKTTRAIALIASAEKRIVLPRSTYPESVARVSELEAQRDAGTRLEWTLLRDEGHDLRHPDGIAQRLEETRAFLGSIGGEGEGGGSTTTRP
jgi:hypothetical protein